MKSFLMTLITACLLTAAPITITYAQNFDKAVKAYKAGDYTTAAKEFRLLAEQGDAGAQNILGLMYDQGEGVTQDYVEAVRWHRLAAEQGGCRRTEQSGLHVQQRPRRTSELHRSCALVPALG